MGMRKDYEFIKVLSKRVVEKIITGIFDTVTIFKRKKYVSIASTDPKCG